MENEFPVRYIRNMFRYIIVLTLIFTACDKVKDVLPTSEGDSRQESNMVKKAFKDFFSFSIETDTAQVQGSTTTYSDVWKIIDKSVKNRGRALIMVDADIHMDSKTFRRKAFALANYLMMDTKAHCVKIYFWSRGFRETGGVFAELYMSKDGNNWGGTRSGSDRYLQYIPKSKPWQKLTKDEVKGLKSYEKLHKKYKLLKRKDAMAAALREAAGESSISPPDLKKLVGIVKNMFHHPKI